MSHSQGFGDGYAKSGMGSWQEHLEDLMSSLELRLEFTGRCYVGLMQAYLPWVWTVASVA